MPHFNVAIPITGVVYVEVECASEREAEEAAWTALEDPAVSKRAQEEMEWEYTPHVTRGNVTYAMLNDIEVEEV